MDLRLTLASPIGIAVLCKLKRIVDMAIVCDTEVLSALDIAEDLKTCHPVFVAICVDKSGEIVDGVENIGSKEACQ